MLGNIFKSTLGRLRPTHTPDEVRALIMRRQFDDAATAAHRLHPAIPARERVLACLLGEIAFRQGRDADADKAFKQVLQEDPGNPDAHYGLSLLLYEQGQGEAAQRHAQFACSAQPTEGRFLAQLGLCHVQLGNYPIAEGLLRSALRALPEDKTCWNNMGIVQAAKGDAAYARQCFQKALAIDPVFDSARSNLQLLDDETERPASGPASAALEQTPLTPEQLLAANTAPAAPQEAFAEYDDEGAPWMPEWKAIVALHLAERFDESMEQAERLAQQWPDEPGLACEVAKLYTTQGDTQGGIDSLWAYIKQHPKEPRTLIAIGRAYASVSDFKPSEECLRKAITLAPDNHDAWAALSETMHLALRYQQACDAAKRALELAPRRGQRLLAQLASTQVMSCRYEEALATYEELFAGRSRKGHPSQGGYALCMFYLGRFDEALAMLDDLLLYNPNEPGLRIQRAQLHLLHERYAQGWDDYLYRGLSFTKFFRVLPFPRWEGGPLEGKTIVVLAEQGLGDQVMFASCLPDLLALKPRHVYVEVINRVAPTLARSFPECTILPSNQNRNLDWVKEAGDADLYVPLADLPALFRRSRDAFPREPFLRADPARVEYWRQQLRERGPGPYIGISWRGGVELTRNVLRSFKPDTFSPLVQSLPATWVNLQYGDVTDDLQMAQDAGMTVHHWPQAIADLDEFAALIAALDAVVTVCNTTVHYAGGIGKHVWVLAPHIPEWRYGVSFETMPWYRHVTVLRQHQPGDWTQPVAAAATALIGHFSSGTSA